MSSSTSAPVEDNANATDGSKQSLRHAWLITRTDFRRMYRQMMNNRRQLVGFGIGGLFLLPMAAGMIWGAHRFGTAVGTDAFVEQLSIARMVVTGIAVFVAFMVTLMTAQEYGKLEQSEAILTAIPYREAVFGLLLSSFVTFAGPAVLPVLAVAVAFGIGAGSLPSIPVIVVVLLGVLAFSTTAGFTLGQAVRTVGARVAFVARFKTIIGVLAFIVYIGFFATGAFERLAEPVFTALEATPFGWFADLALVAAPDPAIGVVRPAAAAVVLLAGTTLLGWLAVRLSGMLWYTEPVRPSESVTTNDTETAGDATGTLSSGLTERLFDEFVPRPVLQIAQKSWRRTYRAPMKLQYAAIPGYFLITPIYQSFQAGEISLVLPTSIAIYGAWAAGAMFTLNPLGDEGSVLPITLISGVSSWQFLGGLVFAGVVAGGPLTVLLAAGLGFASPLDPFFALAIAALGGVLCVGACAIGVSVGTAFPKFEHTRISRSRKAIVPGFSAFMVYSLILLVVTLPGLIGSTPIVADWISGQIGFPAVSITFAGLLTTTVLASVAAWIGLRSATGTLDGYTPDR